MCARDRRILLGVSAGIMLGVGAWALTAGDVGAAGQGSDGRTVVEQPQQQPLQPGDCTSAGPDGGVICRGTSGSPAGEKQPGEMISPEQAERNLKESLDRLPDG